MKISEYNLIESTMIEYKENLEERRPKSWLKTVSAFANTKGGTILFGIRNSDKELIGIENASEISSKISEFINAKIQPAPRYEVNPIRENDKQFIELKVADGPSVPYYYVSDGNKIAYVRTGDESVEAAPHVLNALILKGQNNTFDALPSPFKMEDLSFTLLEATLKKEIGMTLKREADLISIGLLDINKNVTYAGVLFSDQGMLRQSRIFCTRWKGNEKGSIDGDALDDKEYTGSIIALLDNAETFIKNNSKNQWTIKGMMREEKTDYPREAVREALVNAIIHRDYQIIGSEIHVDMYDNRLEISSPGGMITGSKVQDLDLMKIPSIRRNNVISDLFSRLHLMERRGSGITRILRTYENFEKKPIFFSDSTQFLVLLPNKSTDLNEESPDYPEENPVLNKKSPDYPGESTDIQVEEFSIKVVEKLDKKVTQKTKINIIQLFKRYGYKYTFNRENVCEQFNVSKSRASEIINNMKKWEIIEKIKNTQYKFIK